MSTAIDLSKQVVRYSLPAWYPELATAWLVSIGVGWLTDLFLCARFLRMLRQRFPEIWSSLGSPTLFHKKTFSGWPPARFISTRAYESTGDPQFIRFCARYRLFGLFSRIYIFAGLILIWIPLIFFGQQHRNA